jgi:hypothetical protein
MFIDHGHHLFLPAHSWATETHCAPKGANEVCFGCGFYKNIAPLRGGR